MEHKTLFSFKKRMDSFKFAFEGLSHFYKTEHHAWVHSFITVVVVLSAFILDFSSDEWLWLVVSIFGVLSAEMLNSAIEELANIVHPDFHPQIKIVKDLAAGGVLLISIGAAIIGIILFTPPIIKAINL